MLACEHVEVEFRDSLKFVSAKDVTSWLDRNYGICTGQRLDSLDLHRIEKMLLSRGPIVGCEAWTDDLGVLHIEIWQRRPVLRFSYGAGYGTENDVWYKATSELEPEAMVAELRAQGVAGIYLNLDGYPVEEQQQTLQELLAAAGCDEADAVIHGSGMIYYIPLG